MTAPPFDAVRRVAIGGIELAYVDVGRSDDPPVVLIHGLACGMRMWVHQIRALATRTRVIAYDLRGHGLSGAPDDPAVYSAAHLGRDLAGLLDRLAIARARIVGFSLGGGPALALALNAPQRVDRLVLADVGSGAENPWLVKRLSEIWVEYARRDGRDAMIEDMLRCEFFRALAERGPASRRYARALLRQHTAEGICHTLEQVVARRKPMFRLRGRLARLAVPTLVVTGARDFVCHKAERLLLETIPGVRGARVPGVAHMAPVEAPGAFTAAIEEFLLGS